MSSDEEEWGIERIMYGDGKLTECGLRLEADQLYGCASLTGGPESFWPISLQSIDLTEHTKRAIVKAVGRDTDTKISAARVCELLKEYLSLHRGKPFVIGGIGARGSLLNVRKHIVRDYGPNAFTSNEDTCFVAALANAVDILCGRDAAQRLYGIMLGTGGKFCTLKQLFSTVHGLSSQLSVRRVAKADRGEYMDNPFMWVARRKSGVWIIRVIEQNLVDHCIVVDGSKGLIHDSACRFPMRLSEQLLRRCGGEDARRLVVAEVRELVKQKLSEKRCRKRKRDE